MRLRDRVDAFWHRYRLPLILAGAVGWVLFISLGYRAARRAASGTNKGAGELLQIGALPVT
jgi:hypothetical protein